MEKLKPCPFCGHMPIIKSDNRYPPPECKRITAYEAICINYECIIHGADNVYFRTPAEAVEEWNRRAE